MDNKMALYIPLGVIVAAIISFAFVGGPGGSNNAGARVERAQSAQGIPQVQQIPQQRGDAEVFVFSVSGLTCGSCEAKIKAALAETNAVGAVVVDTSRGLLAVEYTNGYGSDKIAQLVTDMGYPTTYMQSIDYVPAQQASSGGGCGGGGSSGGCGGGGSSGCG